MIEPGNGRVVHYHPGPHFQGRMLDTTRPLAAIIVHVHSDRLVNLTVFDNTGHPNAVTRVQLLQDDDRPAGEHWAEWMSYQKGQAAKTEALERQVAGAGT